MLMVVNPSKTVHEKQRENGLSSDGWFPDLLNSNLFHLCTKILSQDSLEWMRLYGAPTTQNRSMPLNNKQLKATTAVLLC